MDKKKHILGLGKLDFIEKSRLPRLQARLPLAC